MECQGLQAAYSLLGRRSTSISGAGGISGQLGTRTQKGRLDSTHGGVWGGLGSVLQDPGGTGCGLVEVSLLREHVT